MRCGVEDAAEGDWNGRLFYRRMRAARHALNESSKRAASVESSNSVYNEIARRSVSDLYMLVTDTPEGPYPYAGIPWFSTPFGRDGLITALMTLWLDPAIAKGVLGFLAATQATAVEPERDAEPGKILHEMRHGEMANLREVPFGRYYGSIDATPLFVLLLGEYYRRTGDLATVRSLWPNAEAALAWIDRYGDRDGDGFVEYYRQTKEGLANQGWKDSFDAIFHRDGRLAEGPIALCEVQGYVYGAKHHAAVLAEALGYAERAAVLAGEAEALRRLFEARFWCEELSTYALALDGAKEPCRVVASNAGQLLFTGIISAERAQRVARTLLSPAAFGGWGIRTIGSSEARYNPMSYHNGSVWPHDNGLIAMGLARYGLQGAAAQVFGALFDAASYMDLRRLPELYCGFARVERNAPTQYPVACSPQAWASATPLALLQASPGPRTPRAHRRSEVLPTDAAEFPRPRAPAKPPAGRRLRGCAAAPARPEYRGDGDASRGRHRGGRALLGDLPRAACVPVSIFVGVLVRPRLGHRESREQHRGESHGCEKIECETHPIVVGDPAGRRSADRAADANGKADRSESEIEAARARRHVAHDERDENAESCSRDAVEHLHRDHQRRIGCGRENDRAQRQHHEADDEHQASTIAIGEATHRRRRQRDHDLRQHDARADEQAWIAALRRQRACR